MKDELFEVVLVVEVKIRAASKDAAAEQAETRVQGVLDKHAKRLGAVVGADYADVRQVTQTETS